MKWHLGSKLLPFYKKKTFSAFILKLNFLSSRIQLQYRALCANFPLIMQNFYESFWKVYYIRVNWIKTSHKFNIEDQVISWVTPAY